jgi:hypothetical protein
MIADGWSRMLKALARLFLIASGFAFALFCLFLAYLGGFWLHAGWTSARLAASYEAISFGRAPLQFALEIGGNAFLLATAISGLAAVVLISVRGIEWLRSWPYVIPGILIGAFCGSAAAAVATGRAFWVLPAAIVVGCAGLGAAWSGLRDHGLPIDARISDVTAAMQNKPAKTS